MIKGRITALRALFGKHNIRFKTSEYYHYGWILEFDNEIFYIFRDK